MINIIWIIYLQFIIIGASTSRNVIDICTISHVAFIVSTRLEWAEECVMKDDGQELRGFVLLQFTTL